MERAHIPNYQLTVSQPLQQTKPSNLPIRSLLAASEAGYNLQLQRLDDEFEVQLPANLKYKGLPRPELDEAWESLINHMNIRVHPEEARRSNFSSVELNDGSGDLAALPTVFHSIHCLKTLRRMQFPESYPETFERYKPPFAGGINAHVDHCIDKCVIPTLCGLLQTMRFNQQVFYSIRQALMCQGDLALYHYEWTPGREHPLPIAQMEHICVDWDGLMTWAARRSFSIYDGLLTNPFSGK